jgi:hypothetical protein
MGFYAEGLRNPIVIFGSIPIVLLCIISATFIIVTIFQYNRRTRQIAYSKFSMFLLIALSIIIFYNVWKCMQLIPGSHSMKVFLVFPLIAIILIYLAIKAILKDERLLKSVNRIR